MATEKLPVKKAEHVQEQDSMHERRVVVQADAWFHGWAPHRYVCQ
jgi:hypothetical protein